MHISIDRKTKELDQKLGSPTKSNKSKNTPPSNPSIKKRTPSPINSISNE
jgi:hypothetical protein